MQDKLVVLKLYDTMIEAEVDQNVLKTNDIECNVSTDERMTLAPFFSDAESGYKLYVFEKDAEKAKQLIEEYHKDADSPA